MDAVGVARVGELEAAAVDWSPAEPATCRRARRCRRLGVGDDLRRQPALAVAAAEATGRRGRAWTPITYADVASRSPSTAPRVLTGDVVAAGEERRRCRWSSVPSASADRRAHAVALDRRRRSPDGLSVADRLGRGRRRRSVKSDPTRGASRRRSRWPTASGGGLRRATTRVERGLDVVEHRVAVDRSPTCRSTKTMPTPCRRVGAAATLVASTSLAVLAATSVRSPTSAAHRRRRSTTDVGLGSRDVDARGSTAAARLVLRARRRRATSAASGQQDERRRGASARKRSGPTITRARRPPGERLGLEHLGAEADAEVGELLGELRAARRSP